MKVWRSQNCHWHQHQEHHQRNHSIIQLPQNASPGVISTLTVL
jgi:hypothetical protein